MAICQVCGCKTEDLDFVKSRIGSLDKKVCSFCGRQLKNLDSDSLSDTQLKWLAAVVRKDVPEREKEVSDALMAILEKHGEYQAISALEEKAEPAVRFYKGQEKAKSNISDADKDKTIAELTARVDKLEKTIIAMKRSQLIKLICEIAIPVILGIIILIILFSSDVYEDLVNLLSWY